MFRRIMAAYRQVKAEERKQRDYQALVGTELNYVILKDLMNSARWGVAVTVTLKDGSRVDIKPDNPFDRYQQQIQVERAKQRGDW